MAAPIVITFDLSPVAATSANRGAIVPPRPPAPPGTAQHPADERGVVHQAGAIVDGVQLCRRCGMRLPIPPPGDSGFEVGGLVEHRRFDRGQDMIAVKHRASSLPRCDAPAGGATEQA